MKKDLMTDEDQEIWSAIRYLDPDEKQPGSSGAVMITLLAIALLIGFLLIELRLRAL